MTKLILIRDTEEKRRNKEKNKSKLFLLTFFFCLLLTTLRITNMIGCVFFWFYMRLRQVITSIFFSIVLSMTAFSFLIHTNHTKKQMIFEGVEGEMEKRTVFLFIRQAVFMCAVRIFIMCTSFLSSTIFLVVLFNPNLKQYSMIAYFLLIPKGIPLLRLFFVPWMHGSTYSCIWNSFNNEKKNIKSESKNQVHEIMIAFGTEPSLRTAHRYYI